MKNFRGVRNRGRRSSSSSSSSSSGSARGNRVSAAAGQRRADQRALSAPEKKLFAQAKSLLKEGKAQAGARILEQLNMHREAIQALEDAGQIHDAANTLLRMQKPNRAGVVYARHGMWLDAAKAFKTANMPLEVAKCAREGGEFQLAAEHFEKAGRSEDAGECYEKTGDLQRAARFFLAASLVPRAMALYDELAQKTQNIGTLELEGDEVKAIFEHMCAGNVELGLAELMMKQNRLPDVIRALVAKGLLEQAGTLISRSTADLGPMLMAEVNYQDGSAKNLAMLFENVGQHHHAGMVYERASSFAEAGAAFEMAEDFERASYCYERAGLDDRAAPLKERAKVQPYAPKAVGERGGFALASLSTSAGAAAGEAPDDATTVLDMRKTSLSAADAAPVAPPSSAAPAARPRLALDPLNASSVPKFSLADGETHSGAPAATDPTPSRAIPLNPPTPLIDVLPPAPGAEAGLAAAPYRAPAPIPIVAPAASVIPPPTIPPPAGLRVLQAEASGASGGLSEAEANFHKAKFLADLDQPQRALLWSIGSTVTYAENEAILTYNDEPRGVYIITSGVVSCFRIVDGKDAYVDQMGATETFGELWLLADQPTSVRFVATRAATQIRIIDRDAFNELMDKDGTLARKVYKRFTMRLLKRLLKPQNQTKNQQAS